MSEPERPKSAELRYFGFDESRASILQGCKIFFLFVEGRGSLGLNHTSQRRVPVFAKSANSGRIVWSIGDCAEQHGKDSKTLSRHA